MIASDLLQQIYTCYKGKVASRTPAWGSAKAIMALEIANRKQREWAKDSNQVWASLFEIKSITPVISTSTFAYDLDTSFMFPSDFFTITKTTGDIVEIPVTKPQQRLDNTESVYISGRNPKKVTFAGTTIDAGFAGGTLKAPAYYLPADMTLTTSVVAVDDPNWLIYATAAELARNDTSRDSQFGNLIGMANDLYEKMISANNNIGFAQGGTVPNKMPPIGESEEDWTE